MGDMLTGQSTIVGNSQCTNGLSALQCWAYACYSNVHCRRWTGIGVGYVGISRKSHRALARYVGPKRIGCAGRRPGVGIVQWRSTQIEGIVQVGIETSRGPGGHIAWRRQHRVGPGAGGGDGVYTRDQISIDGEKGDGTPTLPIVDQTGNGTRTGCRARGSSEGNGLGVAGACTGIAFGKSPLVACRTCNLCWIHGNVKGGSAVARQAGRTWYTLPIAIQTARNQTGKGSGIG